MSGKFSGEPAHGGPPARHDLQLLRNRVEQLLASDAQPRRIKLRISRQLFHGAYSGRMRFICKSFAWILVRAFRSVSLALRTRFDAPPGVASHPGRLNVAFLLHGGIGDLVNAAVFLQQFSETYSVGPLDIFCARPARARALFRDAPWFARAENRAFLGRLQHSYDLVGEVSDYVRYLWVDSVRLAALRPNLGAAVDRSAHRVAEFQRQIDHHPFFVDSLVRALVARGHNRLSAQGYFGGLQAIVATRPRNVPAPTDGSAVLQRLGLAELPYLTLHNGFGDDEEFAGQLCPKLWPLDHWCRCIDIIRQHAPGVLMVQVGGRSEARIAGADMHLLGQTTLEEAVAVLAGALVHVDGESGLVRLAWALGVTSVVMFGPTSPHYYALDGNVNLTSVGCAECQGLTIDWMCSCPRGLSRPECMSSISPETVASRALRVLAETDSASSKEVVPSTRP